MRVKPDNFLIVRFYVFVRLLFYQSLKLGMNLCTIVGFGPGVSMSVARKFAKEGFTLAIVARTPEKLKESVETLRNEGVDVYPFTADAGNAASLTDAFNDIHDALGPTSVLIYNAFVSTRGVPSKVVAERLTADFQVNVIGALLSVQAVLPAMQRAGKGTILFTGGGLALTPFKDYASLAIGKSGIRSLALTLNQELSDQGIHVATITICGQVKPGTHFDPDAIAAEYWRMHGQPAGSFEAEFVYQ